MLPFQFLVEECADNTGIEAQDSAGLSSGEHTAAHTQHDTEGNQQSPESFLQQTQEFLGGSHLFTGALVALLLGDPTDVQHFQSHAQQAGNVTGSEHTANGNFGGEGEDDQAHSGRDDGGNQAGSDGNSSGEVLIIAAIGHFGNQELAVEGSVSSGGAGDTAHHGGQQNIDMAQTAGHMAYQAVSQAQEPVRNTGITHNCAGGDEERKCHVVGIFQNGNNTLCRNLCGQHGLQEQEVRQDAAHNSDPDGNIVQSQPDHADDGQPNVPVHAGKEINDKIHYFASSFFSVFFCKAAGRARISSMSASRE